MQAVTDPPAAAPGLDTDREIFAALLVHGPEADPAELWPVLLYLRGNRHLSIPDSWYDTVTRAIKLCQQ